VLRAPGVLDDICKEEVGKHYVDDFLQKAFVRAQHRMKQRRMVGMKSAMQEVLGAAVKPEVSIITGGPSVGKSLLLSLYRANIVCFQ
jgi:predicted ATP-dependent serine protease